MTERSLLASERFTVRAFEIPNTRSGRWPFRTSLYGIQVDFYDPKTQHLHQTIELLTERFRNGNNAVSVGKMVLYEKMLKEANE